jgi:hypothetical protein
VRITKKKIAAVVASTAVVALGATSAYAYFTAASGSGDASAIVGSTGAWDVSFDHTASGDLFPGSPNQTFQIHVKNTSASGSATLLTLTASIAADNFGNALDTSHVPISGCKAAWFNASVDDSANPLAQTVAAGATYDDAVLVVSMPTDNVNNQDSCQGKFPAITVTAR